MTADNTQPPARRMNTVLLAMGALFVAAIVAVGGFVTANVANVVDAIPTPADVVEIIEPEPYLDIGPVVVRSMRDLAQLTTVEVVEYTIVEKGTDEGWLEWARGDSLRLIAVANIGAGVDLSGIGVESFSVSDDGVVEVVLPPAEIQYTEVDGEATQILDRDKGLFTKGDPQLESEARRIAETVLVENATGGGILAKAEENAQSVMTNFLISLGYEDVIVTFAG